MSSNAYNPYGSNLAIQLNYDGTAIVGSSNAQKSGQGCLNVASNLTLYGGSNNSSGVTLSAASNNVSSYSLTLPNNPPPYAYSGIVANQSGNISWQTANLFNSYYSASNGAPNAMQVDMQMIVGQASTNSNGVATVPLTLPGGANIFNTFVLPTATCIKPASMSNYNDPSVKITSQTLSNVTFITECASLGGVLLGGSVGTVVPNMQFNYTVVGV